MGRLPITALAVAIAAVVVSALALGLVLGAGDDRSGRGPGRGPGMMGQSGVDSEAAYLAEMVAHHEEAIAAAAELARSERPAMREFGESIVESQSAQVRQMTAWLDRWYPDEPEAADYQPMMRDLTPLSGDRLDRVFLDDMIGHHMMAVMMSQRLLHDGAEHAQVAELARTIRDDQRAEIGRMHRWLALWFGVRRHGGMGGNMFGGMFGGMGGAAYGVDPDGYRGPNVVPLKGGPSWAMDSECSCWRWG